MADILWNTIDATKAMDGTPFGNNWECTGISIDSRTIEKGDLFFAIKGPAFDGHKFVANALRAGAAAAVVSYMPEGCRSDDNLIQVKDTSKALEDLGIAARLRTDAKFIAVTGSVGKTGVKEALASVLSKQGKTHATIGNLNNHFGLPLTLARMPIATKYAVLELGMNHAGELHSLSKMARPDVSLITTIAAAHLENFKDESAICDAKCEIFDGMDQKGCAVLNADNPFIDQMRNTAQQKGLQNIITFGTNEGDFSLIEAAAAPESGSNIKADLKGKELTFRISHDGAHWITNSLAVLAGVQALGADVAQAASDLENLSQLKGRGEVHHVDLGKGSIKIIDESYNANDVSMRAALKVLSTQTGRKIAVLGDMLELGPKEHQIHQDLQDAFEDIDLVFTCGPLMKYLFNTLPKNKQGAHASNADALAPMVVQAVRPNDVISIKSSRGSRTDLVLDALLHLQKNSI